MYPQDPGAVREAIISVKAMDGRTIQVKALPDETISVVKQKVLGQLKAGLDPARFGLRPQSGRPMLFDAKTVAAYGLDSHSTLDLVPLRAPIDYDPPVRSALESLLQVLAQDDAPLFVFIGLGCYDYNHGPESVKRQQCPDTVLETCTSKGLKLVLILIDPDFIAPGPPPPQIYDLHTNWKLAEVIVPETKVRRYSYEGRPAFQLWTCATPVLAKEYGGELKTLAGQDLVAIGQAIARKGGYLVSGNFYAEASKGKPQVAIGTDADLLSELGFEATD
jgi:hypothetical protein